MSWSVNEVRLIGNVGADPDVRSTSKGKVASVSLATTKSWNTDAGKQERTEWHRLTVWNQVEALEKFVKKGSRLYVEGSLEYKKWTDMNGQQKTSSEINVSRWIVLDKAESVVTPSEWDSIDAEENSVISTIINNQNP